MYFFAKKFIITFKKVLESTLKSYGLGHPCLEPDYRTKLMPMKVTSTALTLVAGQMVSYGLKPF